MTSSAAHPRDVDPPAETVQFPTAPARVPPPVPTEAASLAAIERRLGELVRVARLGLGVASAWLLWQVFGDGIAWAVSAATWVAGAVVLVVVGIGVAMYFSPRFRRSVLGGAGRMATRAVRSASRHGADGGR